MSLTPAQLAVLPGQITSASRLIAKQCNRLFHRRIYDGLYTVDQPGTTILTRMFPVNRILRAATNPTPVLSIGNTYVRVNQRATVEINTVGSFRVQDLPPLCTGLTLTRVASGVATASVLSFGEYPTIQTLADAINALGDGWAATVDPQWRDWATADFRAVQGVLPALGSNSAQLKIHVDELPFELDTDTGEIEFTDSANDPFTSIKFGPYLMTDVDDLSVYGSRNGVRIVYDAGFDPIPEDIQQACVELVAYQLSTLRNDQTLKSERIGGYSYELNTDASASGLPRSVLVKLVPYVSRRA